METGEIRAQPVETNLYEYAEWVETKTTLDYPMLKNVRLEFENRLSPNSFTLIDQQHLHQVLENLISNSIKFTIEGYIRVTFEHVGSQYRISVADTGIGISQESLQHIFKPFRQAHEGISRSKGGIGLGLAICKKMVELWHGQIVVESRPNIGSTFIITIPA